MKNAYTQKQLTVWLKTRLAHDAQWALRALCLVYSKQTLAEQCASRTEVLNGVGFTGCDAEFLSSLAQQVENGRTMSPKQMAILFRKMPRYWRQVLSAIPEDKLAKYTAEIAATVLPVKVMTGNDFSKLDAQDETSEQAKIRSDEVIAA